MEMKLTMKNALEAIRDGYAYDWLQNLGFEFRTFDKGTMAETSWENCRSVANEILSVTPRTTGLTFSEALEAMKQGKVIKNSDYRYRLTDDGFEYACITHTGATGRYEQPAFTFTFTNGDICATDWQVMEVEG